MKSSVVHHSLNEQYLQQFMPWKSKSISHNKCITHLGTGKCVIHKLNTERKREGTCDANWPRKFMRLKPPSLMAWYASLMTAWSEFIAWLSRSPNHTSTLPFAMTAVSSCWNKPVGQFKKWLTLENSYKQNSCADWFKIVQRKFVHRLVSNRVSIKQLDYQLEVSI